MPATASVPTEKIKVYTLRAPESLAIEIDTFCAQMRIEKQELLRRAVLREMDYSRAALRKGKRA